MTATTEVRVEVVPTWLNQRAAWCVRVSERGKEVRKTKATMVYREAYREAKRIMAELEGV